MNKDRLKWILIGAALVAIPVAVAVFGVSIVQASGATAAIGAIDLPKVASHPGLGDGAVDMQELLAEALGISTEELEAAQQAAFEASVAAAVDEGKITLEQADQILERERFFGRGFGFHGFGMRGSGSWGPGGGSSYSELLASELGITVEELQAGQESAHEAALDQLLEEGVLTEEQVESARAAADLKTYLDQAALHAEALGISVSEWEGTKEAGKPLSQILEEQGMDAVTYRENLAAATEAAIEAAVADGIITQEQADDLSGRRPFAFGFGRVFGHGRFKGELPEGFELGEGFGRGRGGFWGRGPFGPPDVPQEDTSNTMNA